MTKSLDERIDEDVLGWFGYVERMENYRIIGSMQVVCTSNRLEGRPWKRCIDTVKDCLKKSCQASKENGE